MDLDGYGNVLKYKDRKPEDTVLLIYNILNKLKQTVKVNIFHSNCYYSAKLKLKHLDIYSEGKGKTKAYCMGSAFAEMIERLLNLAHFKIGSDDFYYYGVETLLHFEVNCDLFEQYYTKFINSYCIESNNKKKLLELIRSCGTRENVVTKYHHAYEPYDHLVPSRLIDLLYGTNGMSAGNSKYEAMCQAFCEIIERYFIQCLLKEEVVLFNITNELESNADYNQVMKEIRGMGLNVDVYIIENDIGITVSVLALSHPLIDNLICKIGVHPLREFAIDRTFSELFQNQSVHSIYKQLVNSKPLSDYTNLDNVLNIFRNNSGFFPKNISGIMGEFACINSDFTSYKQVCEHLIDYFKNNQYDIYYTEIHYENMFVSQIIIPRYSEMINPNELTDEILSINTMIAKVKSLLENIDFLSEEQYKYLLEIFSGYVNVLPGILELYKKNCKMNISVSWDEFTGNIVIYCEERIYLYNSSNMSEREIIKNRIRTIRERLPSSCYGCTDKNKCFSNMHRRRLLHKICNILSLKEVTDG